MHATENLTEAERLMTICNSCRYCEGLCAVFPAMELRRSFADGDLNYLANLCHNCGACYADCQFVPPHEFAVNVPQVLAGVRADSWRSYAWPRRLQPLFDRNGVWIAVASALSVAGFILGFAVWHEPGALLAGGSFYKLMPHTAMATFFMLVSGWVFCALVMGFRNFWADARVSASGQEMGAGLWRAVKDVARLRYLDGGGVGCYDADEHPNDRRRLFHHLVFYGFLLCFAATTSGTVLHYGFGHAAPYAIYELPKLLGIPGGIGLVIGAAGLLRAKLQHDPAMLDRPRLGMDTAFIVMTGLTGLTGLLLAVLRETPLMGAMLALHLGTILALYLTMPYGKFVHGLYRAAALVIYAIERQRGAAATGGQGAGGQPR